MNKAVFIDKDGTLIKNIPYNINPDFIEFEDYAIEALRMFQAQNFLLVVVTNQSGVAFNYFTEEQLQQVHIRIKELLIKEKILLHAFYYCPHHVQGKLPKYAIDCSCRKPKPGLILQAAEDMNINLSQSWMIGDILNDTEAGNKAGCSSVLINNGNETEWQLNELRKPDYTVNNLLQAAEIITTTSAIKETAKLHA